MELAFSPSVYYSGTVEKDIRDFFRAERKRRGLNQTDVANNGGIEQSTISKIERDAPYQPSVAIFLGAIRGLGMTASQFFLKFEQQHSGITVPSSLAPKRVLKGVAGSSQDPRLPNPEANHGTPSLAASTQIDLAPFQAFGAAFGKSLGEQLARTDRERKNKTGPRKKPGGGGDDRRDARRRA